MNIWTMNKWQEYYNNHNFRSGLRIRYDKGVDAEVKRAINDFVVWLRQKYTFPIRVVIYVKATDRVKARDGEMVCGTFFGPFDKSMEPYIRISTGDYLELLEKRGKDNALSSIIWTIPHELTHYYQWLNDLDFSSVGKERQANNYANIILDRYAEIRDHP